MEKKTRLSFSNRELTMGGILSSVLAVISVALFVKSIMISYDARGLGSEMVGALGLISLVLSFFGTIIGLLSYKEQDKNYGPSFFGTFTNGLMFIILILFIMMGM